MKRPAYLNGRLALDSVKILFGTFVSACTFRYLTFPNSIVSGGITGISQILNLLAGTPVGVMVIVLNIPLFLWGRKSLGRRFTVLSFAAMLLSSVFNDLLALFPLNITNDPLLASVYGGILNGGAWGLVYTTGASGGGLDIPIRIIRRKKPLFNFGTISLGFNIVIILSFAIIFKKYDSCMYTLIYMYISGKVVDVVAYGPVNARSCFIITDHPEPIEQAVMRELGHGMTSLRGEGAYTGKEREVLLCVIRRQQINDLRKIIRSADPNAFTIITDARGVYGKGFDNIAKED